MWKLLSEFCSSAIIWPFLFEAKLWWSTWFWIIYVFILFTNEKCSSTKISTLMGISNTDRISWFRDERKYVTKIKHNKPKQKLPLEFLHEAEVFFSFSSTSNVSLRFYKTKKPTLIYYHHKTCMADNAYIRSSTVIWICIKTNRWPTIH